MNKTGAWDHDAGASATAPPLNGSVAQVEWAERIRVRVMAEFDRVAAAFHVVALRQDSPAQASTQAIIAIVQEIRAEVMRNEEAGYFIHDWQDIHDQVRQMIFSDPRYQAIRKRRNGGSQTRGEASE